MAQTERFFLAKKLLQFAVSAFSCFMVSSYIIENLPDHDVPRPYGAVAAAAAIESKVYMLLVHDLLCSKMLRQLLLHRAEK